MRCTRIELEGTTGNFAVISRKREARFLEVEVITPAGSRTHKVAADDAGDLRSMAGILHHALEGFEGSLGDALPFQGALELLADG